MSLPVTLYPGYVSIYGIHGTAGVNGIMPPTPNFLFGVISQTWSGMANHARPGQSVMYNTNDVTGTFIYASWPYIILPEDKIILIEGDPL